MGGKRMKGRRRMAPIGAARGYIATTLILALITCTTGPLAPPLPVPFRLASLLMQPGDSLNVSDVIDAGSDWSLYTDDTLIAQVVGPKIAARGRGYTNLHARAGGDAAQDSIPIFVALQDDPRPNVIVIVTDDQDAGGLGYMPVMRKELGAAGTRFERAYVTTPLCCPARATILTGEYPHNHGVLTNRRDYQGGWPAFIASGAEQRTLAIALSEIGYRTGLVGKYLNWYPNGGPGVVPPGWTDWYGLHVTPTDFYGYTLSENGVDRTYGSAPGDYLTDVLAAKARGFIRRAYTDGRPFFLLFTPFAPHIPATPAPRHRGIYGALQLPAWPSFNEADVSDKPDFIRSLPLLDEEYVGWLHSLYRNRAESLLAVDEAVGALISDLSLMGEANETYVVYTSDHGYHMGQHRLPEGKNLLYEEDVRVPLLIRGPGVSAGRIDDHLVSNLDIAPTVAEWAELGDWQGDGLSLVPLLGQQDAGQSWRSELFMENWHVTNGMDFTTLGMHFGDSVYVSWSTGEDEFYDLTTDPGELENLARDGSRNFQALRLRMRDLASCSGATCVVR